MALETNAEAYLPVIISLVKLHARSLWHTLRGGKNGLDLWSFEEEISTSPLFRHDRLTDNTLPVTSQPRS
jgi:hypothetical protein